MGMLTDFFIASDRDARRYEKNLMNESVELDTVYPRASHKGLTGVELSALWATLQQEPLEFPKHMLKVVSSAKDDGLTEAFPSEFVSHLGQMPDQDFGTIAAHWAELAEIRRPVEELVLVLADLKALAAEATQRSKGLFIWYSV
jgi:hypothetical protein